MRARVVTYAGMLFVEVGYRICATAKYPALYKLFQNTQGEVRLVGVCNNGQGGLQVTLADPNDPRKAIVCATSLNQLKDLTAEEQTYLSNLARTSQNTQAYGASATIQ